MKYVIKCDSGFYSGPSTCGFVLGSGYWNNLLSKATVFSSLKEAKDMYNNIKKTFPNAWFGIFEYNPPTLGKSVINEKETVLNNLRFVRDSVLNHDKYYRNLITTAINYIKENVND